MLKLSRRDLAACLEQRRTGATTVAATMFLAHLAGIRVFATGGVGGVHRAPAGMPPTDVSADLPELARTPVCVVCSGAKSILDLPATLEWLETWGVPVIGYQTATSCRPSTSAPAACRLALRADTPAEVAELCRTHWDLGLGGVLVTVPIPEADALDAGTAETATEQALAEAAAQGIRGTRHHALPAQAHGGDSAAAPPCAPTSPCCETTRRWRRASRLRWPHRTR